MSNILVISPIPTSPVSAGNRARVDALTESLKALGHRVFFMHVEQESGDAEAMKASWGDRYIPVPYRRPTSTVRRRLRRVFSALGLDSSYRREIDEWYDPNIDAHVERFLSDHEVDAVLVEYVFLSRVLLKIPDGIFKVIDTHDVFANRHRRYLANGMTPTWFSCSPRGEKKALNRADAIIAIQDNEAAHFQTVTRARVITIGHPIALQPLPYESALPGRILLVGSDNPINVESLNWFISRVLPLVLERCPGAELAVAGSVCSRVGPCLGVRLLGRLDDLTTAYSSAQLVVNPMQFGTGLKIKSVEALGFARALVATPCGAEGLEAGAGTAFRLAREPAEFAHEVVSLLADPAATNALAASGHQFARKINDEIRINLGELFARSPEKR